MLRKPDMKMTLCMQQNGRTFHDKNGVEYTVNGKHLVKCDNAGLQKYNVKPGTLSIDDSAFENCDCLQQVTLPDTVTRIGEWAFSRCEALKELVVSASVTKIGSRAFSNCHSLKSIRLEGKVKTFGDYAFLSCDSLRSIIIPRGTKAHYLTTISEDYWRLLKESL